MNVNTVVAEVRASKRFVNATTVLAAVGTTEVCKFQYSGGSSTNWRGL